ncbi:MAG: hypothetical protein AB7G75_17660 [Candidatus Binatia bacterium]
MIRVFPRVEDTKLMELFRKGVDGQWSTTQIEWETPLLLDKQEQEALAHVLTPVYLGEQTAMLGASAVLPQFFAAQQTEAQLYLATFLLDEARHFEILTRFYQKMDQRPLEVRDLKEIFRYQARLFKSRDRIEWLWGILLSDIFARQFYHTLAKLHPGSLFAHLASRIQIDEARHLAFAELSLRSVVIKNPELSKPFLRMRDDLLSLMDAMQKALKERADTIGLDSALLIATVTRDIEKKTRRLHVVEPEPGEVL